MINVKVGNNAVVHVYKNGVVIQSCVGMVLKKTKTYFTVGGLGYRFSLKTGNALGGISGGGSYSAKAKPVQ